MTTKEDDGRQQQNTAAAAENNSNNNEDGTHAKGQQAQEAEKSTQQEHQQFAYTCRKCRCLLFSSPDIVPHSAEASAKGHKAFQHKSRNESSRFTDCSSYFLDPAVSTWITGDDDDGTIKNTTAAAAAPSSSSEGVITSKENGAGDQQSRNPDTIYCFGCKAKIGAQSWIGSQCSCGQWVTPSFKIHASKVDQLPVAS